ncbi:MAG: hypothetical protein A2X19_02755 [Bacteroidetes bacterium GWE2_39_28]|nr:MAG: hypothetical protein A2X19_02755 [Bacteroidetes bacterium GWE2_39_28]OFZ07012.1 MAG: hypothetical protein A2322_08570 [Bacteroidetes bacterium RIFOXYB2_FULL_39_7]OFZ09566.1 MAG: hypothetical protein A2465_04970 [Bacteroidetes bacterium RIFOXYC2_FULL_39_11]HCT94365.1 hypothetical protein [Rikenellaceae bacterium]
MPPSDWNCQCSVRQTDKDTTPVPGEELVNPAFANNPGESAKFTVLEESPYYKNTEEQLREKIIQESERLQKEVFKEARKKTLVTTKKLVGKTVQNPQVDFKIGFTVKGLKEAINNPVSDPLSKLEVLEDIVKYIKKARYLGKAVNFKTDKKPHVTRYHYFETKHRETEYILVVEENKQGKHMLYAVADKKQTAE